MLERLGEDRAEDDDDRDALDGAAEALLERRNEGAAVDPRDEREEDDRDEEGEEDVPLEARDREEQQGDDGNEPGERDDRAVGDQRPSQRGGRFSTKAVTPSRKSRLP